MAAGGRGSVPRPGAWLRSALGGGPGFRALSGASKPQEDDKAAEPGAAPRGLLDRATAALISAFGGEKEKAAPDGGSTRWLMMAPAFLTHMCIGHPYAWSVMSSPLTRELGVVASTAGDWSLSQATLPISLVFALQGLSAAVAGPWLANIGPRASMMLAAASFTGGLGLAAAGVATHSLGLLYLGYGVLGGTGVGLGYTPPIQTLINWFPDRRGLASGVTIAGFGSGALLFAPAAQRLLSHFQKAPEAAKGVTAAALEEVDGKTFVRDSADRLREVVEATSASLQEAGLGALQEGYYYVGTGSTGVAESLALFGGVYGAIMAGSALAIRRPWDGFEPPAAADDGKGGAAAPAVAAAAGNVNPSTVIRTPQFWLLGTSFVGLASGGMALLAVAKPLVKDVFVSSGAATADFASTFLMLLAAGNLAGRLGWAAVSDRIGRRNTFILFTVGSIPLYLVAPWLVADVVETGSQASLAAYAACCTLAISFMGGTYAILPAYESDLFGSKHVGANHGRMLLGSSTAALAGPGVLMSLRQRSTDAALDDLLTKADPAAFAERFRAPIEDAARLIEQKRVTISSLLEVCPAGTPDPTPFLYDTTMLTMSGVMAASTLAHFLVRPIDPKYFEENQEAAATAGKADQAAGAAPAKADKAADTAPARADGEQPAAGGPK